MARMRFRFIHSCMVLGVLGLLLFYSAFLTSPAYIGEDNGDGSSGNGLSTGTGQGQGQSAGGLLGPEPLTQEQFGPSPVTNSNTVGETDIQQTLSAGPKTAEPDQQQQQLQLQQQQLQLQQQQLQELLSSPAEGLAASAESGKDTKRDLSGRLEPPPDDPSPPVPNRSSEAVSPAQSAPSLPASAPEPPALAKTKPAPPPPSTNKAAPSPTRTSEGPKSPAIRTRDIYESGFSYANPSLCPNDGDEIQLFIMIMSAPGHFSARDAIRLTWGHYSARSDISIAFLIGKTENDSILEGIEAEKHLYDDLIVANFEDSYDNLTLKTMSTLEWIDTYCNSSAFVLKTDDDMFVNVPNLINFISKIEDGDKKQPKIYGRLAKKWKPVRNKKSKYYISFQQYKKTVYPDFTTGPAYLFSTRIARPLFDLGMGTTYLKLEDVYTTGILAQELKIKRMNIGDFANKKVNFHKTGYCALSRLISMHMVAFHEQFELWKKLLDGRTKCKIVYQDGAGAKGAPAPSPKLSSSSSVPGATVKSSLKKKK